MFKVLIVDDERLARFELKRLLSIYSDIEIVAEAADAKSALSILANQAIDLTFVDIHMPEVNGLELAHELDESARFVFCTAYEEYAVDAFSLNAFDYLVKPVEPDRLDNTIRKLRDLANNQVGIENSTYLNENQGLLLKVGNSKKIIKLKDIQKFESVGNYVAVYSKFEQAFIHTSLKKVAQRLDPIVFFKVSRSVIVKIDSIKTIEDGMVAGSLVAILNSGDEIEISRRQANALRKQFNLWS